jgi:hypothetical protein
LLQGPVLEIRAEQTVQRNDRGQQGRYPDHAGSDPGQQLRPRTDAQRKQADHHQQEYHRKQQFGPAPEGQQKVPPQQGEEGPGKAAARRLGVHVAAPETR